MSIRTEGKAVTVAPAKRHVHSERTTLEKSTSGGYRVSTVAVFQLTLLAILAAFGVGLIVHFAESDVACNGNGVIKDLGQQCAAFVDKGQNVDQICSKCKNPTTNHSGGGGGAIYSGGGGGASSPTNTTSPSGQATEKVDLRLPKHLTPVHYDVEIQPFMYSDDPAEFTYKGKVKMVVQCNKPASNVTMHIDLIKLDPKTIKFYGETPMNSDPVYVNFEIDTVRQFLIINISRDMTVSKRYIIEMAYSGKMPEDLRGIYCSTYYSNGTDKYMLTTMFQPTDARRAFPCFDEPALKATFNITLVRPNYLTSISNMPILNSTETFTEGGIIYVKDVYKTSPKMSTYLLAFIISDFEYLTAMSGKTEYRAYGIPEIIDQVQFALDVGVELLAKYEKFYNIEYPLEKQEMIAIPEFEYGAMENWGLISYRERAMLYDYDVSSEADKEYVVIAVAHGLAHMWFGDLVTPAWWDDLWLNEGFSTYMENVGVDILFPEWKRFDSFGSYYVHAAMAYDCRVTSHPVFVEVMTPNEINNIFDSITYDKSASLIRMMRHFLGPDTFDTGVSTYLKSLEYEALTHGDLWAALTKQASDDGKNYDVKDIMDTWTMQMNFPVVSVSRHSSNPDLLVVEQARYLVDKTSDDPLVYTSPYGYQWTIPLTFTSSKNPNFNLTEAKIQWIDKTERSKSFSLGVNGLPDRSDTNGWYLANIQQIGFYRVNYPLYNWKALAEQLKTDHLVIATSTRAQLIYDAFNFAKSGHLLLNEAMLMTEYLDKERDSVPWTAATGEMGYIRRMITFDSLYSPFQSFMIDKLKPAYEFYKLDNTNAKHVEIYARRDIASSACFYGIQSCLDAASQSYRAWMQSPDSSPIDVNLKSIVYCYGIHNGGWDEWQFGMEMYNKSQVAADKKMLYTALTCSSQPWILKQYLDLMLEDDSPIRLQNMDTVIDLISLKTVGKPLVWQFIRERFHDLQKKWPTNPGKIAGLIEQVTRYFNTEFELAELQHFLDTTAKPVASEAAARRAVTAVKANIQWMAQNRKVLQKFLIDAGYLSI